MKKLIYLIVLMLILGLIVSGCLPVVPPAEQSETSSLKKPGHGNGIDLTGYHYNLNLIGKKANWPGGGNYEGDRHTMFVPEDTTGLKFTVGNKEFDGIKISMTQSTEFEVVDGNWFDNEECAFQLGSGTYQVYIVVKAKPAKKNETEYITDITGWVYAEDVSGTSYWYLDVGNEKVSKSKKWINATHIFEVDSDEDPLGLVPSGTSMWVFDYMKVLKAYLADPTLLPFLEDPFTEYFWEYDNKGNKLVKVRFYPDPK